MELVLTRYKLDPKFTLGFITVNGNFECFTCEDPVREIPGQPVKAWKVQDDTAIPYGRYEVQVTFSPKFGRMLPLLLQVPGFEGIRIHSGNYAKDTSGCILPGQVVLPNGVGKSLLAFNHLYAQILNADHRDDQVWITVRRGTWQDRK